jgi:hypothetical protein
MGEKSVSLKTIFWVIILKFFDAVPGWKHSDPGYGMENADLGSGKEKIRIRDLG